MVIEWPALEKMKKIYIEWIGVPRLQWLLKYILIFYLNKGLDIARNIFFISSLPAFLTRA
jgi:hypothetical protein